MHTLYLYTKTLGLIPAQLKVAQNYSYVTSTIAINNAAASQLLTIN